MHYTEFYHAEAQKVAFEYVFIHINFEQFQNESFRFVDAIRNAVRLFATEDFLGLMLNAPSTYIAFVKALSLRKHRKTNKNNNKN